MTTPPWPTLRLTSCIAQYPILCKILFSITWCPNYPTFPRRYFSSSHTILKSFTYSTTMLNTPPLNVLIWTNCYIHIEESYTMLQLKKIELTLASLKTWGWEACQTSCWSISSCVYPLPYTSFHLIAHTTPYWGESHHTFYPTWWLHSQLPHKFEVGKLDAIATHAITRFQYVNKWLANREMHYAWFNSLWDTKGMSKAQIHQLLILCFDQHKGNCPWFHILKSIHVPPSCQFCALWNIDTWLRFLPCCTNQHLNNLRKTYIVKLSLPFWNHYAPTQTLGVPLWYMSATMRIIP